MSVKILKASAGSGKTFALTGEYLRLLLGSDNPFAYRHILAITFTNKATEEMKRRIIGEIHRLATNPSDSPYLSSLVPSAAPTVDTLKERAGKALKGILKDYSSFAISTIDAFFQKTLRSFAHEAGRSGGWEMDLDLDLLVDRAVTRFLDTLGDEGNEKTLKWIVKGVKKDLDTTGKLGLDRRLKELLYGLIDPRASETTPSQETLSDIRNACETTISSFTEHVSRAASEVLEALSGTGIAPEDFNRGFLKAVYDYSDVDPHETIKSPTPSFIAKASDQGQWFPKTKAWMLNSVAGIIDAPLQRFCDLWAEPYRSYATAIAICQQVSALGVATQLREAFRSVQDDEGVLSFSESNRILRDIIDSTDAPFIYEKIGVRFEDYLLDEFQDTSDGQWRNLLPLLKNADANGGQVLTVGDVKQSIYRWRGSDWSLLGQGIQQVFPRAEVKTLDSNWRSCRSVVEFNNAFFPYAARQADRLGGVSPDEEDSVSAIYGECAQQVRRTEDASGCVRLLFEENAAAQMDTLVKTVRDALARKAAYRDIAILVRGNADGTFVAERLAREGIPCLSDEALHVKGSVTVRTVVSRLHLTANPGAEGDPGAFLAIEAGLQAATSYHSLASLAEETIALFGQIRPDIVYSETPFVQAFMDQLRDWTRKHGENLGGFLRDWADMDPKIQSPEGINAVRILTIHKAKGLEWPVVILPFADKIGFFRPTNLWCSPEAARGTALDAAASLSFNVSLSDAAVDSFFGKAYEQERRSQAVDNMNVLYVALTRARRELTVLANKPAKAISQAIADGTAVPAKNLSHLLFAFAGGQNAMYGEPAEFPSATTGNALSAPIVNDYPCRSGALGRITLADTDANEFFRLFCAEEQESEA